MIINPASLCALVLALCLGGCAKPSVVQLSQDTYLLSRSDAGGAFANTAALKAGVIRDANAFAESKGKVAIPISSNAKRPGIGFPSFDYQFRLVDKDSPEARSEVPVVVGGKASTHSDASPGAPLDLYTELTRLDELRKKGMLTDAEFDAQKQKLLDRAK